MNRTEMRNGGIIIGDFNTLPSIIVRTSTHTEEDTRSLSKIPSLSWNYLIFTEHSTKQ